jgi:hypothetical protein
VSKLGQLKGDDIIPGSDHLNIPYLETTQTRIAAFLSAQFGLPCAVPRLPVLACAEPAATA